MQALTERDIETWGNTYHNDSIYESCQVTSPQLVFQKQGMPQANTAKWRKLSSPVSLSPEIQVKCLQTSIQSLFYHLVNKGISCVGFPPLHLPSYSSGVKVVAFFSFPISSKISKCSWLKLLLNSVKSSIHIETVTQ